MDAEYVNGCAAVKVTFNPEEIPDAIVVLREALVEAEEHKMHVPAFANGFFEKLAFETRDVTIQFNFAYLEFGMNFLEKAYTVVLKEDEEIDALGAKLDRIWVEVAPYCVRDSMLH